MSACGHCLRRAYLVAHLAPRIAALLDRPSRRTPGLLALTDEELIAAAAGQHAADARRFMEQFDSRRAVASIQASDVGAICRHAAGYPDRLADLIDAPIALFFRGSEDRVRRLQGDPAVTLVGTRRASPYGLEVAHALGRGLAVAGLPVVSGLALGIDAAAHHGCLDGGGFPVAVLAGGPDLPYPRRHRNLYRRVARHGLVLSEMPPGCQAFRWSFPARNRLMAGMATMTVVIEAADPSGSLITAEIAQDLGRLVGAVPGRITARTAAGSNALLRDGAIVITAVEDVLDELFGAGNRSDPSRAAGSREPALDARLDAVLAGIEACQPLAAITEETGLSASELRAALAELESIGLIKREGLGRYERCASPSRRAASL